MALEEEKTVKNAGNLCPTQEFSSLVKMVNKDKPAVPKPERKQKKEEVNPRQKAMQYSKKVPKPTVRPLPQKIQEPELQYEQVEKELSELELYELRHQQLKNMLRNQM